jgi:hypothetical protein
MAPHTVFIIPYRDRMQHKVLMDKYIVDLKASRNWSDKDFQAIYVHQCDKRPFNRGAMKNIGFLMVKSLYPNDYKNMNIVFHDVDSIPTDINMFPYKTEKNICAHYYGFTFVLGGIVVMKGEDFERTGGFPNFWGWGLEDNELQKRVEQAGIEINRSIFVDIMEFDKIPKIDNERMRVINVRESTIYSAREKMDGLADIKNLNFHISNEMGNVLAFTTGRDFQIGEFKQHDLKTSGGKIRVEPGNFRRKWGLFR